MSKTYTCHDCGAVVETVFEAIIDVKGLLPSDEHKRRIKICAKCAEDYPRCEHCGRFCEKTKLKGGHAYKSDDGVICRECNHLHEHCAFCKKVVLLVDGNLVTEDDEVVCEDCLKEKFAKCATCGDVYGFEKLNYSDVLDTNFCDACDKEEYHV